MRTTAGLFDRLLIGNPLLWAWIIDVAPWALHDLDSVSTMFRGLIGSRP